MFVTALTLSPLSLELMLTWSPTIGCACASVTVTVAVLCAFPFATIDAGESFTFTLVAGPAVCASVACPETLGDTDLSVTVIVTA